MPRLPLKLFKKQSGLRTLFDKSNHKRIAGFFPYDVDEGQGIDADGALRPSYPPTVFTSITETDGLPVFLLNSSTFSVTLNANAIGLFMTAGRYLFDLQADGTIDRTGYTGYEFVQYPNTIANGCTAVLHRGELFIHTNDYTAAGNRLQYTKLDGGTGTYTYGDTTGDTVQWGKNFLLPFEELLVLIPQETYSSGSDGSYVLVQKMSAAKVVSTGFKMMGPQVFRHADTINNDYCVIFADKKFKALGTAYESHPNDGIVCYIWNGIDSKPTRILSMPYRGVIGTCKMSGDHYVFMYDDKNVYALKWDGNSYVEQARTAFTFIHDETAQVAFIDGNFVFFFKKQAAIIYWNIATGSCAEVQNLGLTSGITDGFMSPDALFIFASAQPDAGTAGETGRIIRFNPSAALPSNGTVSATPFFSSTEMLYESNVIVPPVREDARMGRVKINSIIVEGEKLDALGDDDVTIKLYTRDETSSDFAIAYTMKLAETPSNTIPTARLAQSFDIGVNATSFYVTAEYTRTSATSIWTGEIKSVIVDFDNIEVTK